MIKLTDFECCRQCQKLETCDTSCNHFTAAEEMKVLDGLKPRKNEDAELKKFREALGYNAWFKHLKTELLNTIEVNQNIKYKTSSGRMKQGNVIQKTDNLLVLNSGKYSRAITFVDIFTRRVTIMGY